MNKSGLTALVAVRRAHAIMEPSVITSVVAAFEKQHIRIAAVITSVIAAGTLLIAGIVLRNLIAANKEATVTRGRGRTGGVG